MQDSHIKGKAVFIIIIREVSNSIHTTTTASMWADANNYRRMALYSYSYSGVELNLILKKLFLRLGLGVGLGLGLGAEELE